MNSSQIRTLLLSTASETPFTRKIKFIIFLILEPPALICNFIFVYYLVVDRALRNTLHNHFLLALLIVTLLINLIGIPRVLHYLDSGSVTPQNHLYCLIGQWFDYLLSSEANLIMLWGSFERHLLVFHIHFFVSRKHRLCIHYLPLLVIITYLILYYIGVIFIYPCYNEFKFDVPLCDAACYTNDSIISIYDLLAHNFLPVCFISLFSIGLIVRVSYGRRMQHHQHVQWRKYRKMVLQLLYISCLFLVCVVPSTLVRFVQIFGGMINFARYVEMIYFFYLFWLLALLLPFVCIGCLPEVVLKVKTQLTRWIHRNNTVMPDIQGQSEHRTLPSHFRRNTLFQ